MSSLEHIGKVIKNLRPTDTGRALSDEPEVEYTCRICRDAHFVHPLKEDSPEVLCAALNATTTCLFSEILAGASLGEGVHDISGTTIRIVPVLNTLCLTSDARQRLLGTFAELRRRKTASIFEELGLPRPNRDFSNIKSRDVSLDKVLPDRRALDKVVFEALGLTEAEQLEVYRAVVELVKNRLVKAGSV